MSQLKKSSFKSLENFLKGSAVLAVNFSPPISTRISQTATASTLLFSQLPTARWREGTDTAPAEQTTSMPAGSSAAPAQTVSGWLDSADLSHHRAAFAGISPEEFKGLLLQDYGKYGITDMADKQRLFRLIKLVGTLGTSAAPAAADQPDSSSAGMALNPNSVMELNGEMLDGNAALLNLEDHDEDLLPEVLSFFIENAHC